MLKGMMMNRPLKIADMLTFAADVHPNSELVSSTVEGGIHKATYRETSVRARRLAKALLANGIKRGTAWQPLRGMGIVTLSFIMQLAALALYVTR